MVLGVAHWKCCTVGRCRCRCGRISAAWRLLASRHRAWQPEAARTLNCGKLADSAGGCAARPLGTAWAQPGEAALGAEQPVGADGSAALRAPVLAGELGPWQAQLQLEEGGAQLELSLRGSPACRARHVARWLSWQQTASMCSTCSQPASIAARDARSAAAGVRTSLRPWPGTEAAHTLPFLLVCLPSALLPADRLPPPFAATAGDPRPRQRRHRAGQVPEEPAPCGHREWGVYGVDCLLGLPASVVCTGLQARRRCGVSSRCVAVRRSVRRSPAAPC